METMEEVVEPMEERLSARTDGAKQELRADIAKATGTAIVAPARRTVGKKGWSSPCP